MIVGVMEDYKLRDLRAPHTFEEKKEKKRKKKQASEIETNL
jgi:hypothetical protein